MPINDELRQSAIELGRALANSIEMQELEALRDDPDAEDLVLQRTELVKALFSRTAQRISTTMGIRYTDFVK